MATATTTAQLPTLSEWNSYPTFGTQLYYDIVCDGAKYCIEPHYSSLTGKFYGYSLSVTTTQEGEQQLLATGTVGSYVPCPCFSRAASAAKVARDHYAMLLTAAPSIRPIPETGPYKSGLLTTSYAHILGVLGKANATHLDDPDKVAASWGFQAADGRKGFVWAYKVAAGSIATCTAWSVGGDHSLLNELFPGKIS